MLRGGGLPDWTPDRAGYEQFFGEWCNWDEMLSLRAWVHYLAQTHAEGTGDVPEAFFRAAYRSEAQAFEQMAKTNSARSDARVLRSRQARPDGTVVHTSGVF